MLDRRKTENIYLKDKIQEKWMNSQRTYHDNRDERSDGEPHFTCLPFQVQHYKAYVDVGYFVEFILDTNIIC